MSRSYQFVHWNQAPIFVCNWQNSIEKIHLFGHCHSSLLKWLFSLFKIKMQFFIWLSREGPQDFEWDWRLSPTFNCSCQMNVICVCYHFLSVSFAPSKTFGRGVWWWWFWWGLPGHHSPNVWWQLWDGREWPPGQGAEEEAVPVSLLGILPVRRMDQPVCKVCAATQFWSMCILSRIFQGVGWGGEWGGGREAVSYGCECFDVCSATWVCHPNMLCSLSQSA